MPALAPNVGDASSEPGNVPPIVGRELSKGLPALCAEARQAIAPSKMSVSVTRIISQSFTVVSECAHNIAKFSKRQELAGSNCDIKKLHCVDPFVSFIAISLAIIVDRELDP